MTEMDEKATSQRPYFTRLISIQSKQWKSCLNLINPYRYHLQHVCRGRVLEVGCGIGRVLKFLGQRSLGLDHNLASVHHCREIGLEAYSVEEFQKEFRDRRESFDCLLFSHVLEHMALPDAESLVRGYLPYLKPGGNVVLITPQEQGFQSDPTHVSFIRDTELSTIAGQLNLTRVGSYSFPLPRWMGRLFIYNEFVFIARKAQPLPLLSFSSNT